MRVGAGTLSWSGFTAAQRSDLSSAWSSSWAEVSAADRSEYDAESVVEVEGAAADAESAYSLAGESACEEFGVDDARSVGAGAHDDVCTVCYEPCDKFGAAGPTPLGGALGLARCSHVFHEQCLLSWLRHQTRLDLPAGTCPNCRHVAPPRPVQGPRQCPDASALFFF